MNKGLNSIALENAIQQNRIKMIKYIASLDDSKMKQKKFTNHQVIGYIDYFFGMRILNLTTKIHFLKIL